MLFDGDSIVLAGATGRVGGATLRLLHDEGARIAVISRSQATANAAVDGLDIIVAGIGHCGVETLTLNPSGSSVDCRTVPAKVS